jgi:hypothetical protein
MVKFRCQRGPGPLVGLPVRPGGGPGRRLFYQLPAGRQGRSGVGPASGPFALECSAFLLLWYCLGTFGSFLVGRLDKAPPI